MYGDTAVIRRRVLQLREQGVDIRSLADRLVGQVDAIAWTGRAADALRERIRDRASHLREAASRHDAAADSLERHLGSVDETSHDIDSVQRKVAALVADGSVPADFAPPPPGHKDWLTIEIAGL